MTNEQYYVDKAYSRYIEKHPEHKDFIFSKVTYYNPTYSREKELCTSCAVGYNSPLINYEQFEISLYDMGGMNFADPSMEIDIKPDPDTEEKYINMIYRNIEYSVYQIIGHLNGLLYRNIEKFGNYLMCFRYPSFEHERDKIIGVEVSVNYNLTGNKIVVSPDLYMFMQCNETPCGHIELIENKQ